MSALDVSPALNRLRASAARVMRHFGKVRTFRRWAAAKDLLLGEHEWAPTGETCEAACDWEEVRQRKDGELTVRRTLLIEIRPEFEALGGGIVTDWRVVLEDGTERKLSTPAGRAEPLSEDGTCYEVVVEGV